MAPREGERERAILLVMGNLREARALGPTTEENLRGQARSLVDALLAAAPSSGGEVTEAVRLLAAERERQKSVEGWTEEHDDTHVAGEMALAAACYALPEEARSYVRHVDRAENGGRDRVWEAPGHWPWEEFKPTPDDRVRELVKAGALIIAEIERLRRARSGAPPMRRAVLPDLYPDDGGAP